MSQNRASLISAELVSSPPSGRLVRYFQQAIFLRMIFLYFGARAVLDYCNDFTKIGFLNFCLIKYSKHIVYSYLFSVLFPLGVLKLSFYQKFRESPV